MLSWELLLRVMLEFTKKKKKKKRNLIRTQHR